MQKMDLTPSLRISIALRTLPSLSAEIQNISSAVSQNSSHTKVLANHYLYQRVQYTNNDSGLEIWLVLST